MTDPNDTTARRQRDAELQAEIDRITAGGDTKPPAPADPRAEPDAPRPPSPRAFIEQRMRELNQPKKNE